MGNKREKVSKVLKGEKGGIGTIIATVVTIILVLGLIAYAVLSQVAGAKDVGDKGQKEQQKISMMLQDQNTVTGSTVKHYQSQAAATGATFTVTVINSVTTDTTVKDGAVYSMEKNYNANGELSAVRFTQINLSSN